MNNTEDKIYINEITQTFLDYPDDESLAMIVFTELCNHAFCYNCQNKELQEGNPDHLRTIDEALDMIRTYSKRMGNCKKLVLSGGDPMCNRPAIFKVIDTLVKEGFDICMYTGYTIEEVNLFFKKYEEENNIKTDKPLFIKAGRFEELLLDPNRGKSEDKFVLASTNQAFYKWDGLRNLYYQVSEGNVLYFNKN